MPQISVKIHVPMPNFAASYDPTGVAGPLATPAQWTPQPGMSNSRAAFAVAIGHALKAKANASHLVVTAKQSPEFADATRHFAEQYDGFFYEFNGTVYADTPSLFPLLPVAGVKSSPSGIGGDSSGPFAGYLWLEAAAGNKINSYVGETKYGKQAFDYTSEYAKNNAPMSAFYIDWTKDAALLNLFAGASGIPKWIERGDLVLPTFAALGMNLIVEVPPVTGGITEGINAFIAKMKQHLGSRVTWCAHYPSGSVVRDLFANACGGPFIDQFNVSMNGTLTMADGSASESAMIPLEFKNQIMTNPNYADRHVMIECGGDSILVLNQL